MHCTELAESSEICGKRATFWRGGMSNFQKDTLICVTKFLKSWGGSRGVKVTVEHDICRNCLYFFDFQENNMEFAEFWSKF